MSLKTVSKSDLIQFYNQYINPSSPTRAKLSVHMRAQSTPADLAEMTTPAEQKDKVLELVGQYLQSKGMQTDPSQLQRRFIDVDVTKGDQKAIVAAIASHLEADLKFEKAVIQAILEEGQKLLGAVLPSLGISLQPEGATVDSEGVNGIVNGVDEDREAANVTLIDNVHEFKAQLTVSAGARPIKDLSEFEELEAKL